MPEVRFSPSSNSLECPKYLGFFVLVLPHEIVDSARTFVRPFSPRPYNKALDKNNSFCV